MPPIPYFSRDVSPESWDGEEFFIVLCIKGTTYDSDKMVEGILCK
jgi:hypothetical protein